MSRPHIDELMRILDRAFREGGHSLLNNLASVIGEEWEVLPQGGGRSIRRMTAHVGRFKYIYANHGFHDASMDYTDHPATPSAEQIATPTTAAEWLKEAHAYLLEAIDRLDDDAELERPRKAHWGAMVPTRFLIDTMYEHDLYHAGEINKTRALLQGNDE